MTVNGVNIIVSVLRKSNAMNITADHNYPDLCKCPRAGRALRGSANLTDVL